jgi:hypothetical protein
MRKGMVYIEGKERKLGAVWAAARITDWRMAIG